MFEECVIPEIIPKYYNIINIVIHLNVTVFKTEQE